MIKITFTYRLSFMQKILALCLWAFIALNSTNAVAQFAVTEDFRSGNNPDVIRGDDAILTSGTVDPVGAGWLRLTPGSGNRKGYAYINKTFPSSLGILVDFEYKMWRSTSDSDNGADGLSVFLFDGATPTFSLGGYGGSLGYSKRDRDGTYTAGMSGGYLGIGIDAYGNFANPSDGIKRGGPLGYGTAAERPNSIVLRGPTTSNDSDAVALGIQPTNRYLAGTTIRNTTTNANSGFTLQDITIAGTNNNTLRNENAIDYNTVTTNRPGDGTYYRRVQIEIKRLATGGQYEIIVRWKTTTAANTPFTEILRYTTNDAPPALLKMGFAASTGGSWNFHEVRNLLATTPNNMRVVKRADKDRIRSVTGGSGGTENLIEYTIEVNNDTSIPVSNITFEDYLTAGDGSVVPFVNSATTTGGFYIESITPSGFSNTPTFVRDNANGKISSTTISMAANTIAYIVVRGRLTTIPDNNLLVNSATVTPPYDEDMNNNTSTVQTPVIAEDVDLMPVQDIDDACADGSNTYTVRVTNVGNAAASYRRVGNTGNRIKVNISFPSSYTLTQAAADYSGWDRSGPTTLLGTTTYVYTARGTSTSNQSLAAGATYEFPIVYTLTTTATNPANYASSVRLDYTGSSGLISIEPLASQANNSISTNAYAVPTAPTTNNVYYCLGDTAVALTATPNTGLRWYFQEVGGFSSNFAPIPPTHTAGTQNYWVSRVNGNCEGPRTPINVYVSAVPTAGSISGNQNICNGGTVTLIGSATNGNGTGTITYAWQSSTNGSDWSADISGATSSTYQPTGTFTSTMYYRRFTIATNGTGSYANGRAVCRSEATDPVVKSVSILTTPGTIAGDQNICSGGTPTTLSPTGTPAAGTGTLTYRWESFSAPGNTWVTAGSGASYSPGPLTTTTRFRRITIATSTISGNTATCPSIPSNEVTIIVSAVPTVGNIVANQNICNGGTPVTITSGTNGAGTGTGDISYAWQSSTNGGSSWSGDISGATEASYSPGPLTQTTQFKRFTIATNGTAICRTAGSTTAVTITVLPVISQGSVTPATQTICMDTRPIILTGSTLAATGSIASVTYRWEWSLTNNSSSVWETIPGAVSSNYHPPVLKRTTYYRRITIATSTTTGGTTAAVCESVASTPVAVTTKNCVVITNPMIYQRVN